MRFQNAFIAGSVLAAGVVAAGNHPSVFALGKELDMNHATMCFFALIVFTIAIELLFEGIHHSLGTIRPIAMQNRFDVWHL
jgi:hypothetical protein